jgi:hypothetical protein
MADSQSKSNSVITLKTYHLEEEVDPAEFCSPVTTEAIHMFADSSTALCPSKLEKVCVFHKSRPQQELHFNCYSVSPSMIGSSGVGCCVFRGVSVWREATRQPQPTNWLWVSEQMSTALIYGYVQVYRIVDSFRIIAMDDPHNIRLLRSLYERDLAEADEDRALVLRDLSRFDLAYRIVAHPPTQPAGPLPPAAADGSSSAAEESPAAATAAAAACGGGGETVVRGSELENDRIVADWLLERCRIPSITPLHHVHPPRAPPAHPSSAPLLHSALLLVPPSHPSLTSRHPVPPSRLSLTPLPHVPPPHGPADARPGAA